ncbi:MAG TPA: helix-turn-helix domain-containing protein, partial [Polyangiaceae bacterium]|nr:helix-turn-helix domain-containing protein [Polyangiaceae bacterium]
MGIDERRERERSKRLEAIVEAAWQVAEQLGWSAFSVERVAAHAELGRATIYSYFVSIDELVVEMAKRALEDLRAR